MVAFQTRNPLHRIHEELTKRAAASVDGVLLLHPAVGLTSPGDVDHYTRVRTYRALTERYYERDRVLLSLLPLAMRMAGPREAAWHAIIRRNFGANHLVVGRDHAGPGKRLARQPVLRPLRRPGARRGARGRARREAPDLHGAGVRALGGPLRGGGPAPPGRRDQVHLRHPGAGGLSRRRQSPSRHGSPGPRWRTSSRRRTPPRHRQGVCVWFTGLSGSGKSTTADVLSTLLMQHGRQVTVLDGDVVRTHLSKGLGFGREDRDTNILRIGFVASEIARHGGIAVCAAISPYSATRQAVRNMVGVGRFVEVFRRHPSGGLRAARLQGNVREGPRRPDHRLHRNR